MALVFEGDGYVADFEFTAEGDFSITLPDIIYGVAISIEKILAFRPFFDFMGFNELLFTRKAPKNGGLPKIHRIKLRV